MKNVPVEDRSQLVNDNGPGFLAHAFEDCLRMPSGTFAARRIIRRRTESSNASSRR
jgi:hypothetical protein